MIGTLLLAAGLLTGPVEELVLRSGVVMPIEEVVTVDRGSLIFVGVDGTLFSLPLEQIDVEATEARQRAGETPASEQPAKKLEQQPALPVSGKLPHSEEEKERILKELETYSHTGAGHGRKPSPRVDTPSDIELSVEGESDEAEWRRAARGHLATIAALEDELSFLIARERQVNDQLLYFVGGGDAGPYGYLVHELADLRSMIPHVRANLARAKEAYGDFRKRARKLGVPPGWTR